MRIEGRQVQLTGHALERYRQRVRDVEDPVGEIVRLAHTAGCISLEVPCWMSEWQEGHLAVAEAFLMLGEDVAFPLVGDRAVTCVARGGMSDAARAARNAHRGRVRASARYVRALRGQSVKVDGRRE